jgi:hypothetical protein
VRQRVTVTYELSKSDGTGSKYLTPERAKYAEKMVQQNYPSAKNITATVEDLPDPLVVDIRIQGGTAGQREVTRDSYTHTYATLKLQQSAASPAPVVNVTVQEPNGEGCCR